MKLAIDGRAIELDESVERVVIQRQADGSLHVSSYFGRRSLILGAPAPRPALIPPAPKPDTIRRRSYPRPETTYGPNGEAPRPGHKFCPGCHKEIGGSARRCACGRRFGRAR